MKILILKLGVLLFTFTFLIGIYNDRDMFSSVLRSFIAFLIFEGLLILFAVIIIKVTQSLQAAEEDEPEEFEVESE